MLTRKNSSALLLSTMMIFLLSFSIVAYAQPEVTAQLALILDGSGSVGSTNWAIIVEGVASAIEDNLPHDGSVELTVIQFGDGALYAVVEIPPTIVTAANYQTIANNVRVIAYDSGPWTPTAHGIYLGWKEMNASQHFSTAERQLINLVTDGEPNVRNNNATTDEDGSGFTDHWDDVIAAKNIAVSQGLDELDMEGIGITTQARDWFKTWVLHPQPGHIAPDEGFIPGWIRVVATADEFALAIKEKFEVIIDGDAVGGTIIPINGLMTAAPFLVLAIIIVLVTIQRIHKKIQ
jgi:hypothetical protein